MTTLGESVPALKIPERQRRRGAQVFKLPYGWQISSIPLFYTLSLFGLVAGGVSEANGSLIQV